jgi:UDP-N-acetyl-D-mannosaminuronic acid dehydrogenase
MPTKKIAVIGGCGHVGLPLGIAFAEADLSVHLVDINQKAVTLINQGVIPFLEEKEAQIALEKAVKSKKLSATIDAKQISACEVVVFITGTPVDQYLNPRVQDVLKVINLYLPYLNNDQLIILRSTVYPGVVEVIDHLLTQKIGKHKLAFCPERVAQGYGLSEIKKLPQIVSATSKEAEKEAVQLFSLLAPKIKILTPLEAELAKLMTNAWRYLEFAIANQFYMIAESRGLDFYKIFDNLKDDYPRAKYFATPGLAAGPCLFKDAMQLSAFYENNFFLGHSAMLINEGLPVFLVKQLEEKIGSLRDKKIALLGMAFKADNDDQRESLSFKIKKVLESKLAIVLASDIYDRSLPSFEEVLKKADGVILGAPHKEYLNLKIEIPFVDCWGVWRKRYK